MRYTKFYKRILSIILAIGLTFPMALASFAASSNDETVKKLLSLNGGKGITWEQLRAMQFFNFSNDEDRLAGKNNVELKRMKGTGFLGLGPKERMNDEEWSAYLKEHRIPEKLVDYCVGRELSSIDDPFTAVSYYYNLDDSPTAFFDGHIQDLTDKGYVYFKQADYISYSYAPFIVTNFYFEQFDSDGDGQLERGDFKMSYKINGSSVTFTLTEDFQSYNYVKNSAIAKTEPFEYKKGHAFTYPYLYVNWDDDSSESQEVQDAVLDGGSETYDTTIAVTDNNGNISQFDAKLHPDGIVNDGTNDTSEYVTIEEHLLNLELENSPLGQANIDPLEVASNYGWYDGDIDDKENSGIRALRETSAGFYTLITTICIIGLVTTYAYQGMRLALMGYKVKNDVMAVLLYKSLIGTVIFGFGALWGLFANVIIAIASL